VRLEFEIVDVIDALPGQSPTVIFKVKQGTEYLSPSELDLLGLTIGGPTSEYSWWIRETVTPQNSTGPDGEGNISYTFSQALPPDATGTIAVAIEGRKREVVDGRETYVTGDNVIQYIALTDAEPLIRRQVVATANCNACHDRLEAHERLRNQVEYCVICHNPSQTDEEERPAAVMPPESIHFKVLIHRLHTGEHLYYKPFTIYGEGSIPHDFSEVRFPADRRYCSLCHQGQTYLLPLAADAADTVISQGNREIIRVGPIAAACLPCHDAPYVIAHTQLMTSTLYGESCPVCHGEGLILPFL